jgi:hypothetical protein
MAPPDFPIDSPSTDEGKTAARLHAAWVKQYRRVDLVERNYRSAQEELRRADEQLQAALAAAERQGKTTKATSDAEAAYAAAKEAAEGPWQQRAAAAASSSEQRRHEYERYVYDHLVELLSELSEEAVASREAVLKAARALKAAFGRWQACRNDHHVLIGPAVAINGQSLPHLVGVAASASRAVEALVDACATTHSRAGHPLPEPRPTKRALDEYLAVHGMAPEDTPIEADRVEAAIGSSPK